MDSKYLIIHMDDMGSSYAANMAGIELFNKGIVTSCSVMIPCAYSYDFICWWKQHRRFDTGIHFTLTCEWDNGKWRPVGEYGKTRSLWSPEHFMWQSNDDVLKNATPADIYNELDEQIRLALKWGLEPSHLDRHMHTVMLNDEFYSVYADLTKKYDIMCQITKDENVLYIPDNTRPIDALIGVGGEPGLNLEQKTECLYEVLRNLKPGVTQLTIHPVIGTPEIRYIIPDWDERYLEYIMFMADETMEVIKENNIELINYTNPLLKSSRDV